MSAIPHHVILASISVSVLTLAFTASGARGGNLSSIQSDPPPSPNSIGGVAGKLTFDGLIEAARAMDALRACAPDTRDDVDEALDGDGFLTNTPPGATDENGNPILGNHDHDTIMVTEGNGSKGSILQTLGTISHEATHVNNANAGSAEFDPTTAFDEDSSEAEIAEARRNHAQMHADEFDLMNSVACCDDFQSANPAGKADCATLEANRDKAAEHVASANADCDLAGIPQIEWTAPPIDENCCEK